RSGLTISGPNQSIQFASVYQHPPGDRPVAGQLPSCQQPADGFLRESGVSRRASNPPIALFASRFQARSLNWPVQLFHNSFQVGHSKLLCCRFDSGLLMALYPYITCKMGHSARHSAPFLKIDHLAWGLIRLLDFFSDPNRVEWLMAWPRRLQTEGHPPNTGEI